MLLRFFCENLFCFSNPIELMPVAGNDTRHTDHVRMGARPGAPNVLRLAGIYGANGHGKTKLVEAVRVLKKIATGDGAEALKDMQPFRWKKADLSKPSRLVINFRTDEADYEFGIVFEKSGIMQEWLFETRKRNEALLYTREVKSEGKGYNFEFGGRLKAAKSPVEGVSINKFLKVISNSIDSDVSFLNIAYQNELLEIIDAHNWIANTLQPVGAESAYAALHSHAAKDEKFLDFLGRQLRLADTGMSGLKVKRSNISATLIESFLPVDDDDLIRNIKAISEDEVITLGPSDGPAMLIEKDKNGDFLVFQFLAVHKSDYGDVETDITDESSGTRRLMDLFPMLYALENSDAVYVVDELDRKLHPLLAYRFVSTFVSQPKGQLIFTTHTTHLLDLDLLRRDEIWLMQKREDGAAELYSLSDFKIRPDLDIRKGYLQGRFGAIPFLGDLPSLGWC